MRYACSAQASAQGSDLAIPPEMSNSWAEPTTVLRGQPEGEGEGPFLGGLAGLVSPRGARHRDKAQATLGPASLRRVMLEWTRREWGRAGGKEVKKNSPGSFLTEQSLQQAWDNDARQKQNDLEAGQRERPQTGSAAAKGRSPGRTRTRSSEVYGAGTEMLSGDFRLSRSDLGAGW